MVRGLATRVHRKIGALAGGQRMTCQTCHGNGYVRQEDGKIAQCETCDSQGEIKESKNAENRDD